MQFIILLFLFTITATLCTPIISEQENGELNAITKEKEDNRKLVVETATELNKNVLEAPVWGNRIAKSQKLKSSSPIEARKRYKSKLKKLLFPFMIFILIKAIILVPLSLAIIGFKAWNALQLGFVSFVTATVLAVWKFCTKVGQNDYPPLVQPGWELDRTDPQLLAYNAFVPH